MNHQYNLQEASIALNCQILIVEDSPLNQLLLTKLLRRYPVQVHVADNGLEAVRFLEKQSVELILMDIQMPILDGLNATRQIRGELGVATPIVAVTSLDDESIREQCQNVGMNDHVRKPITLDQLNHLIFKYLPKKPTTDTSVSDKTLIDQDYLNEITYGNSEILRELLTLFRERLPGFRATLFETAESGQLTAFSQSAHLFRSALHSLAMLETAANLRKLERAPDRPVAELTRELTALFDDIDAALIILENLHYSLS